MSASTLRLFERLAIDWQRVATTPAARLTLQRWGRSQPVLSGFDSLAALVGATRKGSLTAADRLVNALLLVGADDPLAGRAVLEVVSPKLTWLAVRMSRLGPMCVGDLGPWPDADDLDADLVAIALARIQHLAGVGCPRAVDSIVGHVRDVSRERFRTHRRRREFWDWHTDPADLEIGQIDQRAAAFELDALLGCAMHAGHLRPLEAELIWRYRIGGEPSTEYGPRHGISPVGAKLRRERAEKRLITVYADR